jgi:hypothetical protein
MKEWWIALALIACAADPAPVVDVELRDRLTVVENRLELAEQRMLDQDKHINQTAKLAVLGGPKRRYTGGVGCDTSAYMIESNGWQAQQALLRCGLCDPAPLPAPTLAVK